MVGQPSHHSAGAGAVASLLNIFLLRVVVVVDYVGVCCYCCCHCCRCVIVAAIVADVVVVAVVISAIVAGIFDSLCYRY